MSDTTEQTIEDFGRQWTRYPANDGHYASAELFADICGPLLSPSELQGARVAEIGSGTGRIVRMLFQAGVEHVVAVEPSEAFEVLKQNTAEWADRIDYVHARGDAIPRGGRFDYIFSIGVLHHVPDPGPVMRAAFEALRPGGRMLVWLYGREGNETYLRVVGPLRKLTVRLPAGVLAGVSHLLNALLAAYILLCRFLPLPLHRYANNVIGKFSWRKRFLVIYDQLNPAVAEYYTADAARALLEGAGLQDVRLHHRHGYSWTVIGTKPES